MKVTSFFGDLVGPRAWEIPNSRTSISITPLQGEESSTLFTLSMSTRSFCLGNCVVG